MTTSAAVQNGHFSEPALQHARKDYVWVRSSDTIAQALETVRQHPAVGRIVYFYVVDDERRLLGVVPTRRLLLNAPDKLISEIMVKDVMSLPEQANLLDVCQFFMTHKLLAAPIVDDEKHILGIVDVEMYTSEISELARRDESEDVFQLIGVRLAQIRQASLPVVFGRRFPWLLCNIGGGLACAFLAGQFEGILNQFIALSLFIPIVLALAESVSIQTLSLALQAHHGNQFRWGETLRAFLREIPVGIMLGAACGAVVGTVAVVWQRQGTVALVIFLSISLSVTTAAILGLTVPTALHAAKKDPKLASGPIVLALTDLGTLFYYLGLATWMLG